MAALRPCILLRARRWARRRGVRSGRSRFGKPLVVVTSAGSRSCPTTSRLKAAVGEGEVEGLTEAMPTARGKPGVAARMGDAARAYVQASTISTALRASTSPRSSRRRIRRVEAKILHAVAEAAADNRVDPGPVGPELAALGPGEPERTCPGVRHQDGLSSVPGRCGPGSRRSTWSPWRAARAGPARRLAVIWSTSFVYSDTARSFANRVTS